MLLSERVVTSSTPGIRSMASQPFGFPPVTPFPTMRAAVRCEAPMPSPRKKITFLMPRPRPSPSHRRSSSRSPTSTISNELRTVVVPVASVKVASSVWTPGRRRLNPRTLNPP